MEVGMDIEDGLFFADLNKQISLLIMDDDVDDGHLAHTSSVSLQALSRAIYPTTQPPIFYNQTCTRQSKGTGVFIPQSSSNQRRNRIRKSSSSSHSKHQKSHGSYMNVPPHNSFDTKKHVEPR